MDANRKTWNERQNELRQALTRPGEGRRGLDLFLPQHAALHASGLLEGSGWSFADEVLAGLSEAHMRCLPPKGEHSIAWALWHIARIEDLTMNVLAADREQVFRRGGWAGRMGVEVVDTGSAMDARAIADFSVRVDLAGLLAYRAEVGRATREVIRRMDPVDLPARVPVERLERVRAEGGVVEAAGWLLDYWGGLSIAGLLLMPPTRHNFVHLNEILRIRQKIR